MMLALLSDIQANLQALDACLVHARARGADQFALLGDFVGYGADPVAVLQRVQELAGKGAWLVKGNHDEMAVYPPAQSDSLGSSTAAWTHAKLDRSQLDFLDSMPLTLEYGSMALVHASVDKHGRWHYVTDQRSAAASLNALASPEVRHVLGRHVHHQTLYER